MGFTTPDETLGRALIAVPCSQFANEEATARSLHHSTVTLFARLRG